MRDKDTAAGRGGAPDAALIELDGVRKVFDVRRRTGLLRREKRQVRAVDSLSFTIPRGEMVGYIGPNGAGKSTTIKMLTGILTPSAGRLRVAGIDPARERTRLARRIGVVFGQRTTLWWDLPLIDSYRLMHRMYRIPDARYRRNLDRCVELLELGALLQVPVRQLSLGQRMRGDIAAALLHDPEVLYLDEPTIGLDVMSKARVRGFLRDLNAERGTTVLLTTHDLTDIEQLCRRVMVIDHGRLMYDGTLDGLHEAGGSERTLVVDLERELPPIDTGGAARVVRTEGPRQWLAFPAGRPAAPLVARVAAAYPLVDISVREPDIEAVIARMLGPAGPDGPRTAAPGAAHDADGDRGAAGGRGHALGPDGGPDADGGRGHARGPDGGPDADGGPGPAPDAHGGPDSSGDRAGNSPLDAPAS